MKPGRKKMKTSGDNAAYYFGFRGMAILDMNGVKCAEDSRNLYVESAAYSTVSKACRNN